MVPDFIHELRLATRTLMRRPSFTLLAVLTLAAGIALNVCVFAVLDAYLLRSLPYPGAERLFSIRYSPLGQPAPRGLATIDWKSAGGIFEHQIAWDLDMFYLVGGGRAESVPGAWVTPGFVAGLGIRTQIGRLFQASDFTPGGAQVALISHSLWQSRFGGDPGVLGQRFSAYVSDRPDEADLFTIIGVLPPDFWHVNPYTGILAPLREVTYPYMARLRPGVSPAQAEARIVELARAANLGLPARWRPQVLSTHGLYASSVRPILLVAAWAAAIVFLIACSNVAFLLVVRAAGRHREVSVRFALGASRRRIALMLAAEALVLGGLATLTALGLVALTLDILAPLFERQLGRPAPGGVAAIALNGSSLAAALGAMAVTLVFGLLPIFTAWSRTATGAAGSASRTMTGGAAAARLRRFLIAFEIAGSVALLSAGGLMIRTTRNLLETDLGLSAANVLTGQTGLRQRAYPDDASRAAFTERLLARLQAIPGVRHAAVSGSFAFQAPSTQRIQFSGGAMEAGIHRVSASYLETLQGRLLAGRFLTGADRLGGEPVAVVSESLARRLAGSPQLALGRTVLLESPRPGQQPPAPPGRRTIVGVVADARQSHRDQELSDVYLPILQAPGRFFSVYLQAPGAPGQWAPAVQSALSELDPEISLNSPKPAQVLLEAELARPRFLASLLAGLALFAALLAILGVYGLIAFAVRQQEREVAIRMAIGASPERIVGLFTRQGAPIVLLGTAIGLFGAWALGGALRTQLYQVVPGDPITLAATALAIGAAAFLAIVVPSRRASKADPATLLREE